MKNINKINIDYLQRCKASSPEEKLEWLADALEFAQAKKKAVKTQNHLLKNSN